MTGPPQRPQQPYPSTPPYAAQVPSAAPGPHQGHPPHQGYPPLPPLPAPGPRPWTPVKMLAAVWCSTALVGPFAGAGVGGVLAGVATYLVREAQVLEMVDPQVVESALGGGIALAMFIGGMAGGAVGISAGFIGAAAAALLFTRLPPVLTALASGLLAGASIAMTVAVFAGGGESDVLIGLLLVVLPPIVVVVVVVFLIVLLAARRARRAASAATTNTPQTV